MSRNLHHEPDRENVDNIDIQMLSRTLYYGQRRVENPIDPDAFIRRYIPGLPRIIENSQRNGAGIVRKICIQSIQFRLPSRLSCLCFFLENSAPETQLLFLSKLFEISPAGFLEIYEPGSSLRDERNYFLVLLNRAKSLGAYRKIFEMPYSATHREISGNAILLQAISSVNELVERTRLPSDLPATEQAAWDAYIWSMLKESHLKALAETPEKLLRSLTYIGDRETRKKFFQATEKMATRGGVFFSMSEITTLNCLGALTKEAYEQRMKAMIVGPAQSTPIPAASSGPAVLRAASDSHAPYGESRPVVKQTCYSQFRSSYAATFFLGPEVKITPSDRCFASNPS